MAAASGSATAQWQHRYPLLEGYSHHVYVEGYDAPLITRGPIDAVPSPVDDRIAFSSRGWLWVLEEGVATRLTSGPHFDSRPAWSPDGARLAFVRDDTHDFSIHEIELATGDERVLVDTPAMDLDPVYTSDGAALLYASAAAGRFDIWRLPLEGAGEAERLTTTRPNELRPQETAGRVVYVAKGGTDEVRVQDGGEDRAVWSAPIASMTRPALSPDGRTMVLPVPGPDGSRLELLDLENPDAPIALTPTGGEPLTPAWGRDGRSIYFSEADSDGTMRLYRISRGGGSATEVKVEREDWGAPTGRIRIRTRSAGGHGFAPARLMVQTADGRAHVPAAGHVRFDGQNGRLFFYSSGQVEVELPVGAATVTAVGGLTTPAAVVEVDVVEGRTTIVEPLLQPVWDPAAAGWFAGDHHFHLNYGGPYRLHPDDLIAQGRAEGMAVLSPLTANLHTRFEDEEWWEHRTDRLPIVRFAQEIRSHFLGHVALLGAREMFWPWIWGPGYPVYGADDRPNAVPLRHAQEAGGIGYYVHPVSVPDPFAEGNLGRLPVGIVPDALAGALDALEVACLWSSDPGTAELWYRFLNLGIPVAPSAGTDVMTDFFRTMAVGTTRVYVRTGATPDFATYLQALRAGRSFVTSGPMLLLRVGSDGAQPGEVTSSGTVPFEIDLHAANSVSRVELLVNGQVVWSDTGLDAPGTRRFTGEVDLPAGGWVAARAMGGSADADPWPMMVAEPFAHTAPVWIGERGSVDTAARAAAAADLLRALDVARGRLDEAYAGADLPALHRHFDAARERLSGMLAAPASDPGR